MSPTDTTEKGLESLIMRRLTGTDGLAVEPGYALHAMPADPDLGLEEAQA